VKTIGPDKTYIDYFQSVCGLQSGLNSYGIRVAERRCSVVLKVEDERPSTYRKKYVLPLELPTLPSRVRIIVDDHLLNHPGSDLRDVLTGRKSFQQALNSSPKSELEANYGKRGRPTCLVKWEGLRNGTISKTPQ
jgi:hypothetical protein